MRTETVVKQHYADGARTREAALDLSSKLIRRTLTKATAFLAGVLASWIVTFPCAALFSALAYLSFRYIGAF